MAGECSDRDMPICRYAEIIDNQRPCDGYLNPPPPPSYVTSSHFAINTSSAGVSVRDTHIRDFAYFMQYIITAIVKIVFFFYYDIVCDICHHFSEPYSIIPFDH
uniref:Uncharacterized protein n=1 Tax=Schizaphis graminum TaxID=13262 RepID=A0A2S2NJQ0_SCHGA